MSSLLGQVYNNRVKNMFDMGSNSFSANFYPQQSTAEIVYGGVDKILNIFTLLAKNNSSDTPGASESPAAVVTKLEKRLSVLHEDSAKCDDVVNNAEKYVDKSLLEKATQRYQDATKLLGKANTNLQTAETNLKSATNAYDKLSAEEKSDSSNPVVKQYNEAKEAYEQAKEAQAKAQEEFNAAKEAETKESNEYADNLNAVKNSAETKKAELAKDIEETKQDLEKAKNKELKEFRSAAKQSSGYLSEESYSNMFDKNGNLVYSMDADYKAAAKKAASKFLKSNSPEEAKQFLKLYDKLNPEQKKEFISSVVDKAKELAKQ